MGLFNSIEEYYPGNPQKEALKKFILSVIKSQEGKAELSTYIRMEIEAAKNKFSGEKHPARLSYDMLTKGNVNMQAKMAASGYDVYGRTIMSGSPDTTNSNIYKTMKNRINYGRNSAVNDYKNRGSIKYK